jgi:hypothetical protein
MRWHEWVGLVTFSVQVVLIPWNYRLLWRQRRLLAEIRADDAALVSRIEAAIHPGQ